MSNVNQGGTNRNSGQSSPNEPQPGPFDINPEAGAGTPWQDTNLDMAFSLLGDPRHNPDGATVVNVEAIKAFAHNLGLMIPPIDVALNEIDDTRIEAGYLGAGHRLRDEILGPTKLRETTRTVLTQAKTALMNVAESCRNIATRYSSVEDLNAMDMEAFSREVSVARGVITGLTLG